MNQKKTNLIKDLFILLGSIIIAILLVKTHSIEAALHAFRGSDILASFLAGIFFTSVFTTVPATVALGEIAQEASLITTAFLGGMGALIGDLIIFRFVRDSVSTDFEYLFGRIKHEKFSLFFRGKFLELKTLRWVMPLLGALVIASPLPDELGLILLGLSKTKTNIVIPLSFSLNFLGIILVGLVARAVQ